MNLSKLANKMIRTILIVAGIALIISIIYYRSLAFLPFLFGVVLGALSSIVKVILLDRTVNKAVSMEKKAAQRYVSRQQLVRMLVSAVPLLIGAFVDGVSIWGAVVGVLAYQLGAYSTRSLLS